MGGKGGGGSSDGSGITAAYMRNYDTDPETGLLINKNTGMVVSQDMSKELGHKDVYFAARNKAAADAAAAAQKTVDDAKAAAATPAAAAVTTDTPAAATAEPPPANNTLAPSIGGGGTTVDPNSPFGAGSGVTTAGDTLGGTVLNPPKYWTGNIGNYKPAPTSQAKKGSMSTTQT